MAILNLLMRKVRHRKVIMWLPKNLPDGVGGVASVLSCSLSTESPRMSFSQMIAEAETSPREHRVEKKEKREKAWSTKTVF